MKHEAIHFRLKNASQTHSFQNTQTEQMPSSKQVIHMDLDTFFVSVERLMQPELIGKPVMIGSTSDRGVVASCSYEARTFGIHSAMPMKLARQLCPEALILRGDSGRYSHYSNMVTDIIKEAVPLYEKTSVDEFYIDMSGMDRFFGTWKMASELRERITKETGLPISFGLSSNKTVSKVATGIAKPDGQKQVAHGSEKPFMAPLPIDKIPMVGSKTAHLLRSMGVEKVFTLQKMPVQLLERVLGKHGPIIWKKANGIDNSPVVPYSERKSISTERTFERDTIDVEKLTSLLVAMVESLAFQLRMGSKLTACITVKLRYSDFNTYSKQLRIPYTSCDHTLIDRAKELFEKLYERRMLVRLIGVRLSHLVGGGHQINAFEDTEEMMNLYQAMDKMRERYGSRAVVRAVGMGAKSIGGNFNPFNGGPPMLLANRRN